MNEVKDYMDERKEWIGVDLDCTLAHYEKWEGPGEIGAPLAPMVERVKGWLAEGRDVRIFTARCWPLLHVPASAEFWGDALHTAGVDTRGGVEREMIAAHAVHAIRQWCKKHLGQVLAVTCVKDIHMLELFDDRAVQVEANTGHLTMVGRSTRGLT
jgi:hypothetical protein